MASFNKVILMGNLTRDPDVRATGSSGMKVARLGLAVNERRRDRNGQMHPCSSLSPRVGSNSCTESMMSSNHLILCCPLLLLPSIFPSIRVFSNELALYIKWPKDWIFSLTFHCLSLPHTQLAPLGHPTLCCLWPSCGWLSALQAFPSTLPA